MTTANDLCFNTTVPAWANGATATRGAENETAGDDTWELTIDGKHVGCMYDSGNGYEFAEECTTRDLSGYIRG